MSDAFELAIAGMIVGQALLALALLPLSQASVPMRRALALFFAALAAFEAYPLVAQAGEQAAVAYFYLSLPAALVIAPALWLYLRAATNALPATAGSWRHLLPALLALIPLVFVWQLSPNARGDLSFEGANGLQAEDLLALVVLAASVTWFVQVIVYGVACVRRMLAHRKALRHRFASIEGRELRWVDVLAAGLAVYVLQFVAFGLTGFGDTSVAAWVDGVATLLITALIAVFAIFQRPPLAEPGPPDEPPAARYAKSGLSEGRAEQIAEALRTVMSQKRTYEDPTLSLRKLASAVSTPPDYVTQALSGVIGQTFFDFVNGHRVSAACRRLAATDDSVTDIALGVGFNSRSAFYRAFRHVTGITPSAWRKREQAREAGPSVTLVRTGAATPARRKARDAAHRQPP